MLVDLNDTWHVVLCPFVQDDDGQASRHLRSYESMELERPPFACPECRPRVQASDFA